VFQLIHANFCSFVIIAQTFANAETHFAHDSLKSTSTGVSLQNRHDAFDQNITFVFRVIECGRDKKANDAFFFVNVQPFWPGFKGANIAS
jgi:hypothetical protein